MRNSTAYIIAGLITLTSLPMYWAIYQRSHGQPLISHTEQLLTQPPQITLAPVVRPVSSPVQPYLYYAWNQPLPNGYKCSGAGGIVYRTRHDNSVAVVDVLKSAGVPVRCGGQGSGGILVHSGEPLPPGSRVIH